MPMHFTDNELRLMIAWAEWRTAKSLGIIDEDQDSFFVPKDAVALISASKGHEAALQQFVDAYSAWYGFHLQIYKAGKSGKLSASETAELVRLTTARGAAKDALVSITPI